MKAIEFTSKITAENTIEIPRDYIDEISGTFRVIILLEAENKTPKKHTRTFEAFRVATKGFKFNRMQSGIYRRHA